MRRIVAALFVVGLACAPKTPVTTEKPSATQPAEAIQQIGAAYWAESMRIAPTWATYLGDRSRDAELPDVSWAARNKHLAVIRDLKKQLAAVDRSELTDRVKITAEILDHELTTKLDASQCHDLLWKVDQLGGWQVSIGELPSYHTIETDQHVTDLATRYRNSRQLFEGMVANLKMGMEKGYVSPRMNVDRVIVQLDNILKIPAAKSPYLPKKSDLPKDWSDEKRARTIGTILVAVEAGVYPGLRTYSDFLKNELRPKARPEVGVSAAPRGAQCYRALIRLHTGSTQTPDELHTLGLSEVKRIRGEIIKLMHEDGFKGNDVAGYFKGLKKKKGQYFTTAAELVEYNEGLVARAQAALPRAFGTLPKTPVKMKEIEAFRAADAPAAYYYGAPTDGSRPAYYYVNTLNPKDCPLYNMAALAFHEAVPGHHLQIALSNENMKLPEFQRHVGQTAFVEGWALYAEGLSDDLGLYKTRHERLGMYNYELWRAVRLVVDTGMHAKGWSRKQAVDFLSDNTGNPTEEVANEIDRYITWPGQALAYKWGQLEIRALRKQAEMELGASFDMREFHDRVLEHGAIPLPTLRSHIEHWIQKKKNTTAGGGGSK